MKVGIDASRATASGRGIERYTNNLLRSLGKAGCDHSFVLFSSHGEPIIQLGLPGNFKIENPQRRFRMIRRKHVGWIGRLLFRDVDLFHFPNSDIWHSKYGKTVVTLHDLAPLHFPGQFFRNEQERRNYYEGLGAIKKNADIVITDSEYSRQDIIKKLELSPSKVITVFLGVDDHFSPFRLTGDHWDFLKRKYGIESPFILFLGGMDFRKNAGNVIAAFIDSRQSMFAKYKLIVVGDHAVDSEQSLRVRGLLCDKNVEERVVFCGRIDDHELLVLYNAADLFVFPSLFEGFGFPLLEAMACGCPTISSSCASLPELSGDASVVVDPYDVNSIQKGMLRVISSSDLRSELREKGFRQSARFGWDKTAAQTLAVYRQVVGVG